MQLMSQFNVNQRFVCRFGLLVWVALACLVPVAASGQVNSWPDTWPAYQNSARNEVEPRSEYDVGSADSDVQQFDTNSIITAVFSFTVGFAACFFVVHSMLPSLVHAQCTEIVRDHLDLGQREPDIRVVVLDRDHGEELKKPRRATRTVSVPDTSVEPPSSTYRPRTEMRVGRVDPQSSIPSKATDGPAAEQISDTMLSQIYQQNLSLREQMRDQTRHSRPTISQPNSPEGADR